MHLRVAVGTASEQQLLCAGITNVISCISTCAGRKARTTVGVARMSREVMTLLTQIRLPSFQHGDVVRAMRVVAIETVVTGDGVLKQEGAALLGVAGVAGLIDRVLDQLLRTCGTVRTVATGTHHLTLVHWMVRSFE